MPYEIWGKKLTFRVLRTSKVTNNRSGDSASIEERVHVAKSMGHDINTADKSYDESDVSHAIKATLCLSKAEGILLTCQLCLILECITIIND